MTAGEILVAAARRVEQGWCQHVPRDEHGNVCMRYALEIDPLSGVARTSARRAAREAVLREIGAPIFGPWNDAPGRTKEEVIAALLNAKRHLAPEDI